MITGPSGSGKTWTAHDIAEVLSPGGRRVHIDSEPSDDQNTAAELYADHFTFDLIDWRDGPYDPRDLALTIRELGQSPERPDVVIVDSLSPFWRGEGGTLDIAGGAFGGWRAATPAQEDLVAAILAAPFHVILCVRAKQDYAVEQDANGKQTVRKLGLAPVQRDDLEYEVQVSAVIDVDHRIDIGKTRCADLAGKSFHAGHQRELATIYKAWLARGTTVLRLDDVVLIGQAFDSLPDGTRHSAKRQFVAEIGRPEQLEVEQLDAAWAWLGEHIQVPPHPYADNGEGRYLCTSCGLPPAARWHDDAAAPWTPGAPAAAPAPAEPPAAAEDENPFPDDVPAEAAPEPEPVPETPEPEAAPAAAGKRKRT
jgi:energy-coupling factor transporter ATP-binding protein EcfA2